MFDISVFDISVFVISVFVTIISVFVTIIWFYYIDCTRYKYLFMKNKTV